MDYYYPAVPGSAPVIALAAESTARHELERPALQRLARRTAAARESRLAAPPGWRLVLGLWVADALTLAGDSLATWWTALMGTGELHAAAAVYDEVHLFWAPAGFSPVRLAAGANLMPLP